MSAWRSGPAVIETLGDDRPPPSRRPWVTTVLVLLGVAVGFALGVQSRGVSVGGLSLGVDPPEVAAGALRPGPNLGSRTGFALSVHNGGAAAVDVAVAAVPGLSLRRTPVSRIAPGRWSRVAFDAELDCASPPVAPASATLDVTPSVGGGDAALVEVSLAEQGVLVSDLRAASCTPQRTLTPARITGVWLLERAFGRWTGLTGSHVLEFRRDGSFVADPEGLVAAAGGVPGRYRLRGPLLDAVQQGFVGFACLPGERALWHAGQLLDGRVVLRFLRGRNCPDQPGELWLLRRLAR